MKRKIARMWSDALRSGRFKQGAGSLSRTGRNEYCCLGVLCELAIESGVDIKFAQSAMNTTYDNESMHLPPAVMKWAGMHTSVGFLDTDKDDLAGASLIIMNDGGASFEEIANTIDDNHERL